ncbi:MAG: hypothetical protein Faunusvirus18_8 [Faunusvirus sp.]|uniref:Uncharacterized protein n=1 Tax=Faunusvirus sp. TaxID=2487766 RepID=A0A3G5A0W7_9VIRU|nr:MAG: hypothetical protein Faunusvirus18_8 [Faunusvirus sp.]
MQVAVIQQLFDYYIINVIYYECIFQFFSDKLSL